MGSAHSAHGQPHPAPPEEYPIYSPHPRMQQCFFGIEGRRRYLRASWSPVSQAALNDWRNRHTLMLKQVFGVSLPGEVTHFEANFLLLPEEAGFVSEGVCSQVGTASLYYPLLGDTLALCIERRASKHQPFTSAELLLLLYMLTTVGQCFHRKDHPLGTLHPASILLSEDSKTVRVATALSWLGQLSDVQQDEDRGPCFRNEEEQVLAQQGKAVATGTAMQSDDFAIGMTLLACITLKPEPTHPHAVSEALKVGYYPEAIIALAVGLAHPDPLLRTDSASTLALLSHYHPLIVSEQDAPVATHHFARHFAPRHSSPQQLLASAVPLTPSSSQVRSPLDLSLSGLRAYSPCGSGAEEACPETPEHTTSGSSRLAPQVSSERRHNHQTTDWRKRGRLMVDSFVTIEEEEAGMSRSNSNHVSMAESVLVPPRPSQHPESSLGSYQYSRSSHFGSEGAEALRPGQTQEGPVRVARRRGGGSLGTGPD